jgi:dienelactone hydrolase
LIVGLSLVGQENDAIERGTARFEPTAAEASLPEPFRLEAASFDYERTPLPGAPAVSKVTFPSPVVTPDIENNTVHAEYFRPSLPGRRPAVVVLHILGADFALSRYLASRLADRGVAALFVKLPYYGERRPTAASRFLSADMDRSMRSMRQGVLDVRRAIAWLGGRPEVDPDRLGVTGISLGGIISALAAEVEPRIGKVGILLGGGGLADILWNMPEPEARRYQKLWLESGRTLADLEALTRPVDPLTYADRLAAKKVLMIAGRVDEVVPPRAAERLWTAAGRPEIIWYDCGHYSAVAYLLPAMRRTVAFFEGE